MTVEELFKLIPDPLFEKISGETRVDYQVKKLTGKTIFQLILMSMLNSDKLSLRVMESYLMSAKFRLFSNNEDLYSKYNSIRDRICTINPLYFEKLFEEIFSIYNGFLNEQKSISKVDSTYVGIAAKLFEAGILNGTASYGKRHVKYSVELTGSLPSHIRVYTDQKFVSEDMALSDLILTSRTDKDSIIIFDRGLQSRNTFDKMTNEKKYFIGRSNPTIRIQISKKISVPKKKKNNSITVIEDEIGYLKSKSEKWTDNEFRTILARINKTGEIIRFVTNLMDENPYVIAGIYKSRWEIEVFFKFIKQHLNIKHLVSRNLNGIKVMIYMTMILSILIIVFKKLNKISTYKIAKLKFEIELDEILMKEIVRICGGDPNKANHLWNTS